MSLPALHPAVSDTGIKQDTFTVAHASEKNYKEEINRKFWLLLKFFKNNFSNSCWFEMLLKLKDE